MKKQILLLSLIFALGASIYAKPNYKNGNGTILSQKKQGNTKVTVRKFELSLDLAHDRNIYSDAGQFLFLVVGKLDNGTKVNITQLITIEFPEDKTQVWYKITSPQQGYILECEGDLNVFTDPYFENNYEIIDTIKSSGKKWTVRRLVNNRELYLSGGEVRDNPGTSGTKIILKTSLYEMLNCHVIAITEETDTVNDFEDCNWVKVKTVKDGSVVEGWVFSPDLLIETNGLKFNIPEDLVWDRLGWEGL